jgi:hypothetical protein
MTNSEYLNKATDAVQRSTGYDIRSAMGGKSLAEKAEDKLKRESQSDFGMGGYSGGY